MQVKPQLLAQAEQLFLRYGIRSVTMDDLARELGVSKKTLYQYVENKADLVRQVVAARAEQDLAEVNELRADATDAMDELFKVGEFMTEKVRRFSPAARYDLQKYYAAQYRRLEHLHERYFEQFARQNLERGQQEGLYRDNLVPATVARLFVRMSLSVADVNIFPIDQFDVPEVLEQMLYYHLHAIASERGRRHLGRCPEKPRQPEDH